MSATSGGIKSVPDRVPKFPYLGRLFNRIYDVVFVGLIVVAIFVFGAAFGEGTTLLDRLGDVYQKIIYLTTDSTPWTQIMRENRLYLIVPATIVLVVIGWLLPRTYTRRANMLVAAVAIGFVAGHVFW